MNGTLKLEGYVRGQSLNVNGLMHIPGWGDFQISQIVVTSDPYPMKSGLVGIEADKMLRPDLEIQESLEPFEEVRFIRTQNSLPRYGFKTFF